MSDIAPAAAPPAAEPAAPAVAPPAPASDAPAPAPAAAPAAEALPTDPAELQQLVGKLQKENVTYKDRFRPWEQAVGNLHPQDQEFILGFVGDVFSGDPAKANGAAARMRAALDQMSPADAAKVKDAIGAATDAAAQGGEFDPFDQKNIEKIIEERLKSTLDERDQAAQQERAVADASARMGERAKTLADKHGIADFGDARTKLGRLLYLTAHNDFATEPDPMVRLDLAAQAIEEDLRKQGQALLKAKSADAGPSPAPADAVEPSGVKKPRDLADASKSARQRVDKILAGEVGT